MSDWDRSEDDASGFGVFGGGSGGGSGLGRLLLDDRLAAGDLHESERRVLRGIEGILRRERFDSLGTGEDVSMLVEGTRLGLEAAVKTHGAA